MTTRLSPERGGGIPTPQRSRFTRCGTTARRLRTRTGSATTSRPLTRTVPDVGSTRVVSTPIVVVLTAPFGPRRPKISPRATSNDSSSTALAGLRG